MNRNLSSRILSCLLCLTMIFSLAACGTNSTAPVSSGSNSSANAMFKAGTYTSAAKGNFGDIKVSVTFTDDAIEDIAVGDNEETPSIAGPVFEKLPQAIIEGQTLKVDLIAGATNSSRGLLEAVTDCVTQAGGDVEALKSKEAVKAAKDPVEKSADVVIIGGGGAGVAAAAAAAEKGVSVILIEKGAALGGNTLRSGGGINTADPERQSKMPMNQSLTNELKAIQSLDENTFGDYKDTIVALKKQVDEYFASGDTTKLFDSPELHMYNMYVGGKRTDLQGNEIISDVKLASVLTHNALDSLNWMVSHDPSITISDNVSTILGAMWPRSHGLSTNVGSGFISPLATAAQNAGAEFIMDTKAEELIVKDGRVVGVKATQTDGTPVTLNAAKGVIMATGGFAANAPMVAEYNTYWPNIPLDMKSTNTPNATGDGIVMGKAIGANLVGMGFAQLMPSSHPVTGALSGGVWTSAESQVFVNKEGKRFVNEYAERDVLASAALKQTDALFYIICDQITAGDPQPGSKNSWGDVVDDLVANGDIYRADTLEDLANQIGMPADALVAEIEKYNAYIDANSDPEFGKTNFGPKIAQAPFYATPRSPSLHHTMGGLQINTDTQVIDTNGNVIPGLYAAGEVTGGIHAGNRLGGNALADIIVFGKIAGENAAEGK